MKLIILSILMYNGKFVLMVPWLWHPGELYLSGRIDTATEWFAENMNRAVAQFLNGTTNVNIEIRGNHLPFFHLVSCRHGTRQTATYNIGLQGPSIR